MECCKAEQATDTTCSPVVGGLFVVLSDDIILNILANLESDPRDWARLACVSTRFASLLRNVCYREKCFRSSPSLASDLGKNPPSGPPGGWAALHKLSVCCPGLLRAGVLLENSDFGLEREIGPDEDYIRRSPAPPLPTAFAEAATITTTSTTTTPPSISPSDCWSLFDDLYFDTIYDISETHDPTPSPPENENAWGAMPRTSYQDVSKKRKIDGVYSSPVTAHLASGAWNLSREQGSKLLANRFRDDSLYICEWPGCIHVEEKRNYKLFRGLFKNFKRSRVWRTINESKRSKIELNCAFCDCKEIWDLHSAFCLRTVFGFHDDGEPVVRAYVCENGHVSGAWTDRPMFS
ncbi:phytochrome A-associated F-box protein-like [Phalaenopsis equestris]|uniref:phytochrome A-associated F-box protein-like n=1 Tax=Phalaenopsis equestris TaxID=78828 RepID=UPI0009E34AB1|nr:phytochrome A-associated F-box protein-like [Phalaenopsis equestris]